MSHYRAALDRLSGRRIENPMEDPGPVGKLFRGYYLTGITRIGADWSLADTLEIVEASTRAALEKAQAFVGIMPGGLDNPAGDKIPLGTDDTIKGAWKTLVREATDHTFPKLQQTKAAASSTPEAAAKWLDTATALTSEMQTVADGGKDEGLLNALVAANQSIEDAKTKLREGIAHGAKKVVDAAKAGAAAVEAGAGKLVDAAAGTVKTALVVDGFLLAAAAGVGFLWLTRGRR